MTDIEIQNSCKKINIIDVAKKIGIDKNILLYGDDKAKIKFNEINGKEDGKLILVTSINPTPYGEGKTTVSIGLNDGLNKIGKRSIAVLREPSLGPVFGVKGGATGGGYSQVMPISDINLHFTGDMHAITSANDLISAAIDNHIYYGNSLDIDVNNICFRRCLDVNDRALRSVNLNNRVEHFNITAASEVMSVLCLSNDLMDLKKRLSNILIAYNSKGMPIYVSDLKLEGALTVLLKDAIMPNLVQSLENNPVIIHGGPFANIAHGCNSVIATKLGLSISDYVVTEAGFGSDLGASKFFDIKCRSAKLKPNCVVIVATTKALKYNAGVLKDDILKPNVKAIENGISNLDAHIDNMLNYTKNIIVTLNKYDTDTDEEINYIKDYVTNRGINFSINDSYLLGGEGSVDLASKVVDICNKDIDFKLLYDEKLCIKDKIDIICKKVFHAGCINYSEEACKKIRMIENINKDKLPICVAKTQYSISDDPKKLGYPKDYEIMVKDVNVYTGAGFIVVYLGDIMTMPGLSRNSNYINIDIDSNYNIKGIF